MSDADRKERVSMAREICSHRGENPGFIDRKGVEGWEKYEPLAGAVIREAERLFALRIPTDARSASLRAAAERVCQFDWSDNDMDAVAAIEALRRAIASAPAQATPDTPMLKRAVLLYLSVFDACGGSESVSSERFADARHAMREAVAEVPPSLMPSTESPAQGAWMPIETAPKDGTEVLVWCDEGMDIARYSKREEDGVDSMGHDAGWWGLRQPMDPGRSMGAPAYTRDAENQPWAWVPQPKPPYDDDGERLFASSVPSTVCTCGGDLAHDYHEKWCPAATSTHEGGGK